MVWQCYPTNLGRWHVIDGIMKIHLQKLQSLFKVLCRINPSTNFYPHSMNTVGAAEPFLACAELKGSLFLLDPFRPMTSDPPSSNHPFCSHFVAVFWYWTLDRAEGSWKACKSWVRMIKPRSLLRSPKESTNPKTVSAQSLSSQAYDEHPKGICRRILHAVPDALAASADLEREQVFSFGKEEGYWEEELAIQN